jgi:hypothetical protein
MPTQPADSDEQDDFLASDDEGTGTAAAADPSAGGASGAAAFERAADAAGTAQPAALKGAISIVFPKLCVMNMQTAACFYHDITFSSMRLQMEPCAMRRQGWEAAATALGHGLRSSIHCSEAAQSAPTEAAVC